MKNPELYKRLRALKRRGWRLVTNWAIGDCGDTHEVALRFELNVSETATDPETALERAIEEAERLSSRAPERPSPKPDRPGQKTRPSRGSSRRRSSRSGHTSRTRPR